MKKRNIVYCIFIFFALLTIIYSLIGIFSRQTRFSKDIQMAQTAISGQNIENRIKSFNNEVNFITSITNFEDFIKPQNISLKTKELTKRFYSRFNDIITYMEVYSKNNHRKIVLDSNNYFSISKLLKNKKPKTLQTHAVFNYKSKIIKCQIPYYNSQGKVVANIDFMLDLDKFLDDELKNHYLGKNSWYWFVAGGLPVKYVYSEKKQVTPTQVKISKLNNILNDIDYRYKGTLKHSISFENKKHKVISTYYPVSFGYESYGVVFSTSTNEIYGYVRDKTIKIILSFLLIIALTAGYLLTILKQTKIAERNLEIFKKVLDQNTNLVVITDATATIQYVNPRFTEITGYLPEEALNKNLRDFDSEYYSSEYYKLLWKIVLAGHVWTDQLKRNRKNNDFYWEAATISPIIDKNKNITHFIKTAYDITKRKKVEEELRINEEKLRRLYEDSDDAMLIFDNNTIIDCNQATCKLFLATREQLIGKSFSDFSPLSQIDGKESKLKEIELIKKAIAEGACRFEWIHNKTNGETFYADISLTDVKVKDKSLIYCLMRDITPQKKAAEELKIAMQKADEANQTKSMFLANVSHEIRTPMNAILGFTDLLQQQITTPKLKQYIDAIQSSGKSLLMLINDILDLSKIESGKMQLKYEIINPHSIFTEISQIFTHKIESKGLDFVLDISPEIPKGLYFDEIRFRQILFNLIGNAVKFTSEGYVRLSAKCDFNNDNTVEFSFTVSDTGIGIKENQQNKIFESFQQQEGQSTRKFGGTGLGLAITKKLVEMMNGNIKVKSKLDAGSSFIIKFKSIKIGDNKNYVDKNTLKNNIKFKKSNVLVVDDIVQNRFLIKEILKEVGINPVLAESGKIAISLFEKESFSLVLMDLRMPELDGFKTTEILKKINKSVPVIAVTASGKKEDIEKAKKENFEALLLKPINKSILIKEISKYLDYEEIKIPEKKLTQKPKNSLFYKKNEISLDKNILKKLANELSSTYLNKCNEILLSKDIDEIEDFAISIKNLGKQNSINILYEYASKLLKSTENFDTEEINKNLNNFKNIVKKINDFNIT